MRLRLALTLSLLLPVACATTRPAGLGGDEPQRVRVSPLRDGRWKLSFDPGASGLAHETLRQEEIEAALAVFHSAFLSESLRIRVIAPPSLHGLGADGGEEWESSLRVGFASRFGLELVPSPVSLGESRLFRALKLSPKYMREGVREAAREMFDSQVFVASVCLSVAMYFGAWLAPEPLFTKAFAASVTVALAVVVGVAELRNLALACLRLYREAEAARTNEELEAAAARFGKSVGGTQLRLLVLVASLGVGKALPPVPPGGLWGLLGTPRYAVQGGLALGAATTASVVADGSLIISGVAVGEVAGQLCGGTALCATAEDVSGAGLSTRYGPPHTRENPAHNEAIERDLAAREKAGHTELRKNKAQRSADDERVFDRGAANGPQFRKPDVSSVRPDGVRHNTNYVSNPRDLKRELEAFEAMVRADKRAIHELYLLDGTLLRRHVPSGVVFP